MYSARPATNVAKPSNVIRMSSSELFATSRLMMRPTWLEKRNTTNTIRTAMVPDTTPLVALPPESNTAKIGKNTAITMSSITRTERISGVSLLPSRPRSVNSLAIMPDDEIYVTPPSTAAPSAPHPSNKPAMTPGVALKTASITPARALVRML